MNKLLLVLGFAFLTCGLTSFQLFAQSDDNDDCEDATDVNFWGGGDVGFAWGTTASATPTPILTGECCNPDAKDVWYQLLNNQFRYFWICANRYGGGSPEVAAFILSPEDSDNPSANDENICSEIDCYDFESSPNVKGLGYQRGKMSDPQNFLAMTSYQGALGYDAKILVKETAGDVDGRFTLLVTVLKVPTVIAGNPIQYSCLTADTVFKLRGSTNPANGGTMTEQRWTILQVYQGIVDTFIGATTSRPEIKFTGEPPYKVAIELISYESIVVECAGVNYGIDSIAGIDTTILVVHFPILDYPDTIYVQRNKPIKLTDNMLTTGCLDIEEAFTWEPTLGLDNAYIRNPKVTLNKDRTYYVRMNCSGCEDTEKVVVIVGDPPIGINDEREIQLYLSQSHLIVTGAKHPSNVQLFDVQGRLMLELTENDFQASDGVTYADISNNQLQKGIYFAVVKAGGREARMKVLRW